MEALQELLQASLQYDEALGKVSSSKIKNIYGDYPEIYDALKHLHRCLEKSATLDTLHQLFNAPAYRENAKYQSESCQVARSLQTALGLAKGICDHPELTKGRFFFAQEFLRDTPLKNYDPWKAISLCEGKKSERPFVQYQENKSIYLNRASCTVLLVKTESFNTEKPTNINLDTYDEVTSTVLPAGTYVNGLKVLQTQEAGIPVYPWHNIVDRPYLHWAPFKPLDPKKIMAAFDKLGYPHKEKLPRQNDQKGEPSVFLLFGSRYAAAVQWGVLRQFLDAATYINADVILFYGSRYQMCAVNTANRSMVAGMPFACYDAVGWLEGQNAIVIEMEEDLL